MSPANTTIRRHDALRRAFTLIEVLIAIVILALGLLGLGAVFPVVVREQKLGNDATMGVLAANSAKQVIFSAEQPETTVGAADFWSSWRRWLSTNSAQAYTRGDWITSINPQTGIALLGYGGNGSPLRRFLPISERLYPLGGSTATQPQFVWDVAVQRVRDADNANANTNVVDNDNLRIAIFVRRIDPRIRAPLPSGGGPALTLTDLFNLPSNDPSHRHPVGADTGTGLPSGDGSGRYADIVNIDVTYTGEAIETNGTRHRDIFFKPNPVTDNQWSMASQIGQKLLDNCGNVYTVVDTGKVGTRKYVRVSPAIPPYMGNSIGTNLTRVAFTPQVPAAVMLYTVTP